MGVQCRRGAAGTRQGENRNTCLTWAPMALRACPPGCPLLAWDALSPSQETSPFLDRLWVLTPEHLQEALMGTRDRNVGMAEGESLRLSQATEGFTVRRQPSHKGVNRVQWHCWGVSQAS